VHTVAQNIASSVSSAQQIPDAEQQTTFRVSASAILLNIDQQTGKLLSAQVDNPIESCSVPSGNTAFDIETEVPGFKALSRKQYLEQVLLHDELSAGSLGPSRYALPVSFSGLDSESNGKQFLPNAILLHAEVSALTRGLHPGIVKQVLGSFYAVQDQDVLVLRNQFGS
jgi:hypothetical protein